jgi:processive rubber oxygenase RoxA-like protein
MLRTTPGAGDSSHGDVPRRRAAQWWTRSVAYAGVATAVVCTLIVTSARTASRESLSREALDAHFDSGIANLVIEWDPRDRRPEAERRRGLFDFMYQTYRASAWIPQSVFDSNLVTQAVVGDVNAIVGDKVGLVLWKDNPRVPAFGMAPNADDPGAPLKWTVNCLVCHTAEIDGVAYFGAGTKMFDDLWLGESLKRLTSPAWRSRLPRESDDYRTAADANRILNAHHHDKIDSLTRARSTAFAASHVEMYMRSHGSEMPPVQDVRRGDVKTPPLWHTAAKMQSGRWYTDGSFHGPFPLMASSMELEKDRPFDDLIQHVVPTIKEEFTSVIQHLRPPRYPYEIDRTLAARGRELFNSQKLGCSGCHGVYDGEGNVEWKGVHVDVGTDPARLDVVTDQFIDAFMRSPLASDGRLKKSRGYAATPLTGVWANYPYLHNGSVPTLYHLLGPASERPRIFDVTAARRLDRARGGQPLYANPKDAGLSESELMRRHGDDRNWFNTSREGCGNGGHDYWRWIGTDENRRALIEYLKTL